MRVLRPDPRHGAAASRLTPLEIARRDGLLRCGSACPRTDTLSEAFTALGEPPERGHADIVAAAETISQFRCTNLTPSCAQETLAVNNMYELPIPDEYVDNVPDDDDLPALSYGVPSPSPYSDPWRHSGSSACSIERPRRARPLWRPPHTCRSVRSAASEGTSGSRPRPTNPAGLAPGSTKSRRRRITQTAPVAGCDASSAPGGPNARPGEQSLVFPHAHIQVDLSAGPAHPPTRLRPHYLDPVRRLRRDLPSPMSWDEAEALLRRVLGAARIEPRPA